MARLAPLAGRRVLDVGCGCGATSLALAAAVGPSGGVLGVDISAPMLARARERAAVAGVAHARFEAADAQTHAFPPASFDTLFSRFGVMFFVDPAAAFANLARALVPGARLAFVCWQALPKNPWMAVPLMAAAQHVALPPPPPRVTRVLAGAGFADVAFEAFEPTIAVAAGADLDATVEFLLQMGPAAQAIREAGEGAAEKARGALREALGPYDGPDGVRMASAAWIVTARRA
jgi:SAM-dependent methyltransferase